MHANAEALRQSARSDGFASVVEVNEVAVARRTGRQPLVVVEDASWSHLADRGTHSQASGSVEVDVVALDDLRKVPPTFMKIDVEGSELAVLEGAERLLRDVRPVVLIEVHGTSAEVCAYLRGLNYVLENVDGSEPPDQVDAIHILGRPLLPH